MSVEANVIVDNLLEARRKKPQKKAASPTTPAPVEPPELSPEQMSDFVMKSFEQGPMLRLLALAQEHDISVGGKVERTSHHYVHQNSTSFSLYVEYSQDVPPEVEKWVDENANAIEAEIAGKVVDINHKIYRALEREWDSRLEDSYIIDEIEANDRTFDEEGNDEGDFQFNQLSSEAKEHAIERWRRATYEDPDTFWSEYIIEEWTNELEKMGFGHGIMDKWRDGRQVQRADPDISWSGFSSQGDGASFTTNHFDFEKYVNYFVTGQDKVEGPMSDEERAAARRAAGVQETEEDVDAQISQVIRDAVFNDYGQIAMPDATHQAWNARSPQNHYQSRAYSTEDNKVYADLNIFVWPRGGAETTEVSVAVNAQDRVGPPDPRSGLNDWVYGQIRRKVRFYIPVGRRGEFLARLSDFWERTKEVINTRENGMLLKPQKLANSIAYTLSRVGGEWKKEHAVERHAATKAAVDKMIADDPEAFRQAAERVRNRRPQQEADEDALMKRITSQTMANTFPYESFMKDISQKFWAGGFRQYRWADENRSWTIQIYVTIPVKESQKGWEVSVEAKHIQSGRRWRNELILGTEEEKSAMGPQVKGLVDRCSRLLQETFDNTYDSEMKKKGFLNAVSGMFNLVFRTQGYLIEI